MKRPNPFGHQVPKPTKGPARKISKRNGETGVTNPFKGKGRSGGSVSKKKGSRAPLVSPTQRIETLRRIALRGADAKDRLDAIRELAQHDTPLARATMKLVLKNDSDVRAQMFAAGMIARVKSPQNKKILLNAAAKRGRWRGRSIRR